VEVAAAILSRIGDASDEAFELEEDAARLERSTLAVIHLSRAAKANRRIH